MRINRLLIAGIVSVGLLTSCANNELTPSNDGGPATIKLTLATGGTRTGGGTYASGNTIGAPTGDGTLTNSSGDEAKLNLICVGLFKQDGTTVSIQEIDLSSAPIAGGVISKDITTTTEAYDMVVAANVPTNKFKGITKKADFIAKAAELAYTTSITASASTAATTLNSQQVTALPMYGAATNINPAPAASTASVTMSLTRMVARVGIKAITTAFDVNGAYAGATFTPTEVFMYNANTSCNWDGSIATTPAVSSAEATTPTGTSFTASATAPSPANTTTLPATGYEYLSSGLLNFGTKSSSNTTVNSLSVTETDYLKTSDNQLFFYVFPNNATSPTKLVIKGTWFFNSKYEVVYYPVIINHAQTGTTFTNGGTSGSSIASGSTDSYVAANTRYTLSATIMGKGSNSPATNVTPAVITLKVDVTKWADTAQDVIF
jgi:hypothetical protein